MNWLIIHKNGNAADTQFNEELFLIKSSQPDKLQIYN